ncbi:T9SS type A sorting domain-containing protein [Fulvivirgaceae bacterium PWU4]|uniref:T9SS type A sorting domain-containing protein n=1 Tax=Chryseosolibacter histidini TaxID=2782349 RepID=A0AAP2DPN0_9BACT|nr:T9SS type A sorting domain-containing protein [Chryseosolibacter histidini]MBT1699259.1 T9SS type A sorting domain-containing protein [Chryseosolibacter histidini]
MKLSVNPIRVRCHLQAALGMLLLFLCQVAWARAPLDEPALQCTPPGASVLPPARLTCSATSITLQGSATAPSVTYLWSGPGGYSSMLQNPVVSLPGTYTLTVTNNAGGCTSSTSVEVIRDIALPGAIASVSHALDCAHSSVTLQATTSITNATFRWIGSNFISLAQYPAITAGGGYTLNVTNPDNGCTSTATVNVTQSTLKPGVTPSVSGPITCANPSVQLGASSPTAEATYSWTGPENFSNNTQDPSVMVAGTYTVTATNPSNSCTSTASVNVQRNVDAPGANITVAGPNQITCVNGSVTLSGSSPTTDVSYQWTGPSSFSSTVQNPVASAAGTYVLITRRTSNGCTSQADYTVVLNNTRPGATASVLGQLNCINSQVTLLGASQTSNVTYRWIGPTNSGFTSNEQSPVTSVKGGYTLTVTNTSNGCTSTTATSVIQSITLPANVSITPSTPSVLNCSNQRVTLNGASTTSGVAYSWTGPGPITNPLLASASVTQPGTYTLTVTNPANQCIATRNITIEQNIDKPENVQIQTPAILTCDAQSVALVASSGTAGVTYSWSGPGPITNPNMSSASVSQPGDYSVLVTNNANGCTETRTVAVLRNIEAPGNVVIAAPEILTCSRQSVALAASSQTSGVGYQWSGPGTIQNPTASTINVGVPGVYNLVVTNNANGCKTPASVTVAQNIVTPTVTTSALGVFTCNVSTVTLKANPSTGLQYQWTGPGAFSSTVYNPSVNVSGTYAVTVTDPANGCTSTSSVATQENKTEPGVDAAVLGGTLTCSLTAVFLEASSGTGGVQYSWTGPDNYSSDEQSATTNVPGPYTVTATNTANGCTSLRVVVVEQDIARPENVLASSSGNITCDASSVNLYGDSDTPDVTYGWTGPDTFTSGQRNPEAFLPGIYVLTVTSNANGCKDYSEVTILQNTTAPQGVTATASSRITCEHPSITLTGTSITPDVTYSWAGPGFSSSDAITAVSTAGSYTLTVKDLVNGCVASKTVTVEQDRVLPGVTAGVSGQLNCVITEVTLNAHSETADVLYSWTGPESFVSNLANPVTAVPGLYTVIAEDPDNKCTSTSSVTVVQNTEVPQNVTATYAGTGIITCSNPSIGIMAGTSTGNVTYSWSGPGTVTNPNASNASVTTPGLYTVTVTNQSNRCFATAGVNIDRNIVAPQNVVIDAPATITCASPNVQLRATTSTGTVSYLWTFTGTGSDPIVNPATSTPSVSVGGTYRLVVTNTTNGCTTTPPDVTVPFNKTAPNVTIGNPDGTDLTCFVSPVRLTGPAGAFSYLWTSPQGFNATTQNISVTAPAEYTLTLTSNANGCSRSASRSVSRTITTPSVQANVSGTINCTSSSVALSAVPSAFPVTYSWTGPGTISNPNAQQPTVSTAGLYTVTITTPGGCTATASRLVESDFATPENVTYEVIGTLNDCGSDIVQLLAESSTPGASLVWTGENYESQEQPSVTTAAGDYTLTATHPTSNCKQTYTVTVVFESCEGMQGGAGARSATHREGTPVQAQSTAETENPFTVGVYPNPARDYASIEFTPDGNYHAVVEVYTLLNVKVAEPYKGAVSAGKTYTALFSSGNHSNGVYIYRIRYASGKIREGRFVVLH